MNKKLLAVIIAIAIIAILLICIFVILYINKNKDVNEQNNTSVATTASVSNREETSSTFYDEIDNDEYDDTEVSGSITQIYDSKYEKIWKSKDGKITFTINNKLGLYGRGAYDGIFEDNLQQTKIEIGQDDYRNLKKRFGENKKHDGYLDMYKTIFENGDYVGDIVLGGFYIADDNNKFIVTVDTVRNKHLKTGYKKGDKIVFYQVDE